MLKVIIINFMLIIENIDYASCERRVVDGKILKEKKTYMVYITQTRPQKHKDWLCGGVIVHPSYILTSAACIEDSKRIYAVAGYEKYAKYVQLDECTKARMKKIVYTFVSKDFYMSTAIEHWADKDIAVVQVETPYDFKDKSYADVCSYTPSKVPVNFDAKYELPDTKVMVLGWGSTRNVTVPPDNPMNSPVLLHGMTRIYDKQKCKEKFPNMPQVLPIIDKYMICTRYVEFVDEKNCVPVEKEDSDKSDSEVDSEKEEPEKKLESETDFYTEESEESQEHDQDESGERHTKEDYKEEKKYHHNINMDHIITRRRGICQNDHGGPLIAWINNVETVIGVASVYRVNSKRECVGPFLFTSTARFRWLVHCALHEKINICHQTARRHGFKIIKTAVNWTDTEDHD